MAVIQLPKGIQTIDIQDADGNVTATLRVNTADANIPIRYYKVIDSLEQIENEYTKRVKQVEKKKNDDREYAISISGIRVEIIQRAIDELNSIFGVNAMQKVFADCIEINPDFMPSEYELLDFLEKVTPLMQTWFAEHRDAALSKYGVK